MVNSDDRVRVYIADDLEFGLEATEQLVSPALHVVGRNKSLPEAIAQICSMELAPQVVFMDIDFKMPHMDGISALQQVKERRKEVRFILFTAMSDAPEIPFLAFRLRAEGFLYRSRTRVERLVRAAQDVASGRRHWDDDALRAAQEWRYNFKPAERRALVYLATTQGTNEQIGEMMKTSAKQAASYIQGCMEETEIHKRGELGAWARNNMRLIL